MRITWIKFIILVSLSSAFAQKVQVKCDKRIKDKFDKSEANIYGQFGHEELKFPETKTQLEDYCKISKASNEFIKNYGQHCLKGLSQTLNSLIVYNTERTNKQYCSSNGKLKDKFVEWAKCGNKAKTKMSKCWDKMMVIMAKTKQAIDSKSKIHLISCNYYGWVKCTMKAIKDMGSKACPQNAVNGYDQHLKIVSGDAFHFMFRRYEDNEEICNDLYKQLTKTKPNFLRKTPFLDLYEVFDTL